MPPSVSLIGTGCHRRVGIPVPGPSGRVFTSIRQFMRSSFSQASNAWLRYLLSPKITSRRGKASGEIWFNSCGAATPSSTPAAVINTATKSPSVSMGTNLNSQRIKEHGPGAIVSPLGETLVHGAFGKQVVRQHIPPTTGTVTPRLVNFGAGSSIQSARRELAAIRHPEKGRILDR
jgi:hypothetical protein